jgi:glycosyltransferase involved in cell wall biosynthesis
VDDLRWFAPNRYCTLPVPALRRAGLAITLEGEEPARLAVIADGQCAVAGFEYARRHQCPLLLYVWDLPPWRLGRGRPDFVFELGSSVRRIPRPIGGYPERAGYYSRIRFVARRAAALWCPSSRTVSDVRERFGIDAERVPFCYDSERFNRNSLAPADPTPVMANGSLVLCISRLVPHKNHAAVLRAAARLTPRPVVRIIGQGPEAAPLRRLAAELGVTLQLKDEWARGEEIVAAYRAATLVVSPSRFEGFGLTPMESIAMGVPVVASDIPTHREFVDRFARFFPLDDDAALAAAIEAEIPAAAAQRRDRAAAAVTPSGQAAASPLADLTIEACAARFLPRLERLLERAR